MTARRFKMIFHVAADTISIKDQSSTNSYYLAIIIHTCRSNSGIVEQAPWLSLLQENRCSYVQTGVCTLYMYMYVCVCVCVCIRDTSSTCFTHARTYVWSSLRPPALSRVILYNIMLLPITILYVCIISKS